MVKRTFPWQYGLENLKSSLLTIIDQYETFAFLDSNDFYKDNGIQKPPIYCQYDLVVGAGCRESFNPGKQKFQSLKQFLELNNQWYFGYLSYDLKNELEALESQNKDYQELPDLYGFIPEWVVVLQSGELTFYTDSEQEACRLWQELCQTASACYKGFTPPISEDIHFYSDLSREDYVERAKGLIDHIIAGDIYEVNFCQVFYSEDVGLDPVALYKVLMEITPAPFASLYKFKTGYIISASMERFLAKVGEKLISQPIKGTIKRGTDIQRDKELADQLQADEKERAENVMIVDLVRNDLAKSAKTGSVNAEELFGIYPFPNVHQMISTVSAIQAESCDIVSAIKNAFPMGSMTGAPKVRAMQLIERYEAFKRGIFSGAVGYISPWQDFDFNVVIRSFIYNRNTRSLSLPVGSAITYDAVPEKEYEECLLKIDKLRKCLYQKPIAINS